MIERRYLGTFMPEATQGPTKDTRSYDNHVPMQIGDSGYTLINTERGHINVAETMTIRDPFLRLVAEWAINK